MAKRKLYHLLTPEGIVESSVPGELAGYRKMKIFGTLDCKSGMRMKKENRVFFKDLEAAVLCGYRPCKNCKPIGDEDFDQIKHLVPHKNKEEFYRRDDK
ncbi:metal-binding protein [archaeon]|jgi:hypothetical protein|nr:metal-binding protein [archaeon]MBT3577579.1 metal-binding protein [archaeon]MBT6820084.1 metal-binding protein [archaeon]MBT6956777.1 metal-binding protein [archaeon]MBT7025314.1 metal-binding protein [archaeon]